MILEANRGLANRGLVLPAGVEIILPEAPPPKPKPLITLWS
ncbi:conserved domain protein [Roseibium sp. TrichSKD4]|nr:conserved domain protein [Roseibium sp. TrichSKD4]EFO33588.1 conserved domain protein [Roseibium sp. TrichSKD4]